jgi:CheY-like chemotaxis protein
MLNVARILVIDDDMLVRVSIEAVLSAKGHVVSLATNGREGFDLLRTGNYDLVITDLIMPEMAGIDTVLAIREHSRSAKILAISGGGRNADGDLLASAVKAGANAVLGKPFSNGELLHAVDRAIA